MKRTTGDHNSSNYFVNEDVVGGVIGTEIDSDIMNVIQEELCSVVTAAGLSVDQTHAYGATPTPNDVTQLKQAIEIISMGGAPSGGVLTALTFANSPHVPTASRRVLPCNTAGGNIVINLPAVASVRAGQLWTVWKDSADANTVTVNANGLETIGGQSSQVLTIQDQSISFRPFNGRWILQ